MKEFGFQNFFVKPENVHNNSFDITDDEFFHAVKVMRKKVHDSLSAVDGEGHLYEGVITSIGKDNLVVRLDQKYVNVKEPRITLILAQALPQGNAFDMVIEKGTEIGISIFQPIITERAPFDNGSRLDRWHKKALAAMKQSGRSKCPSIKKPVTLKEVLQKFDYEMGFIAHESSNVYKNEKLSDLLNIKSVLLLIGPAGGFSQSEFEQVCERGIYPISLGPRRLRSETAGLVGATKILLAAGELGLDT